MGIIVNKNKSECNIKVTCLSFKTFQKNYHFTNKNAVQFSSFIYYSDKCYIMIFYKQSIVYNYNNIIYKKIKDITNTVAFLLFLL